jgi:hypothetical protein
MYLHTTKSISSLMLRLPACDIEGPGRKMTWWWFIVHTERVNKARTRMSSARKTTCRREDLSHLGPVRRTLRLVRRLSLKLDDWSIQLRVGRQAIVAQDAEQSRNQKLYPQHEAGPRCKLKSDRTSRNSSSSAFVFYHGVQFYAHNCTSWFKQSFDSKKISGRPGTHYRTNTLLVQRLISLFHFHGMLMMHVWNDCRWD